MELLREYSVSDKDLLTQARHTLNFINANTTELNLCSVFKAKEIQNCLEGFAKVNELILACTDVLKLSVYQQSKILKLNRLSALMEQIRVVNSPESFVNHEPVRIAQVEAARQRIFAS